MLCDIYHAVCKFAEEYCASQPCQNGATCVPDGSRQASYRCDCAPGYADLYCQSKLTLRLKEVYIKVATIFLFS